MKNVIFLLLLFPGLSYGDIYIGLPSHWAMSGSVIYDGEEKIGELISKESWPYASGSEFVKSFENGFEDDSESTRFIVSGNTGEVFWVCRSSEYEGKSGEVGVWYIRRFWVNGPILTLYSYESCEDQMDEAIKIASTLRE